MPVNLFCPHPFIFVRCVERIRSIVLQVLCWTRPWCFSTSLSNLTKDDAWLPSTWQLIYYVPGPGVLSSWFCSPEQDQLFRHKGPGLFLDLTWRTRPLAHHPKTREKGWKRLTCLSVLLLTHWYIAHTTYRCKSQPCIHVIHKMTSCQRTCSDKKHWWLLSHIPCPSCVHLMLQVARNPSPFLCRSYPTL